MIIAFTALNAVPYTTMGLLRSPDAYVLPNKALEISFTNYLRREASSFGENQSYEYVPMGMANWGLFNRAQIGAWGGDGMGVGNVKVRLIEETSSIPQVSVGMDNLFSKVKEDSKNLVEGDDFFENPDAAFYEKNSPYIVFSKTSVVKGLPKIDVLEAVVSLGVGRNKFVGQIPIAKRFEGVFGSISVQPLKNLTLVVENDGFNLNLGAQYFYKNFTYKVSYVGVEEQENNRIGLGITWLWDKWADPNQRPQPIFEVGVGPDKDKKAISSTLVTPPVDATSSNNDLLDELRKLREQRESSQKLLEELNKQLKEMETEAGGQ